MIRRRFFIPFWPLINVWYFALTARGISLNRLPFFLVINLYMLLTEPLRWLTLLLHVRFVFSKPKGNNPIFIIGHWRSGTSYLQDLLAMDSRFHYLSLYRMVSVNHFRLTESCFGNILSACIKRMNVNYPLQRNTKLDLSFSGELDVSLLFLGSPYAYTWAHLFPRKFDDLLQNTLWDTTQKAWLKDYLLVMHSLQSQRPNARLILKSPGDTARLEALYLAFPKAQFIYLHRSENDSLHSTAYLWQQIERYYGFQRWENPNRSVRETYHALLQAYRTQKSCIPPEQRIEIPFEALHDHPISTLEKIYQHFDLGELPAPLLNRLHESQGKHKAQTYPKPFPVS